MPITSFTEFIPLVILVTASGALAPGPLFVETVIQGSRSGARAGFFIALGHTLVELPLVFLLAFSLLPLTGQPEVKLFVGAVGGVALMVIGALQVREVVYGRVDLTVKKGSMRSPILIGILLTGFNPFFILWWLTLGGSLIFEAVLLAALGGVAVMYAAHVWMDYVWLTFTAYISKAGRSLLNLRAYRILLGALGVALLYFGFTFISEVVRTILPPV